MGTYIGGGNVFLRFLVTEIEVLGPTGRPEVLLGKLLHVVELALAGVVLEALANIAVLDGGEPEKRQATAVSSMTSNVPQAFRGSPFDLLLAADFLIGGIVTVHLGHKRGLRVLELSHEPFPGRCHRLTVPAPWSVELDKDLRRKKHSQLASTLVTRTAYGDGGNNSTGDVRPAFP